MKWMAAAGVLLAASQAYAQDEHIGARVREWYAKMGGKVESNDPTLPVTSIDVGSDLGLDYSQFVTELQLYVSFPFVGRFYGGAWWMERHGDEIITRDINFAGSTFTASTEVKSDVKLQVYYLSYEFAFPTIPLGDLVTAEVGLLAGIRILHGEGSIDSAVVSGSDQGTIAVPVLGVHGTVTITEFIRAEAEVMGLTFSYAGHSGRYVEAYGEVVGQFGPAFAGVGYKFVSLGLKDNTGGTDFKLGIDVTGIYITAGVRF